MEKFCKYCGSPLEEGQICTCPESQAAAAVAQGAAPAKTPLLKELVNVLATYLRSPRDAAQVSMNSDNHLAIAGIFVGINLFAALLYIWTLFPKLLGVFRGIPILLGLKIQYPILSMLVTPIVLTVVFIGMSGLALFVCSLIAKRNISIMYAMEIAAVASIPSSALLLAGTILGLLSWMLQLLCLLIAGIIWCANGLADLTDYTGMKVNNSLMELGVLVLTVSVVGAVCLCITGTLSMWCIRGFTVNGMSGALNGIGGLLGWLLNR